MRPQIDLGLRQHENRTQSVASLHAVLSDIEASLNDAPKDARIHAVLGNGHIALHDWPAATKAYEKAINLDGAIGPRVTSNLDAVRKRAKGSKGPGRSETS